MRIIVRYTIKAEKHFEGTKQIHLTGSASSSHVSRLEFIAGSIDLKNEFSTLADDVLDEIYVRPSCNNVSCAMYFGDFTSSSTVPEATEFHLTDDELDRITTFGRMVIGDRSESTDVDYIEMSGICATK